MILVTLIWMVFRDSQVVEHVALTVKLSLTSLVIRLMEFSKTWMRYVLMWIRMVR